MALRGETASTAQWQRPSYSRSSSVQSFRLPAFAGQLDRVLGGLGASGIKNALHDRERCLHVGPLRPLGDVVHLVEVGDAGLLVIAQLHRAFPLHHFVQGLLAPAQVGLLLRGTAVQADRPHLTPLPPPSIPSPWPGPAASSAAICPPGPVAVVFCRRTSYSLRSTGQRLVLRQRSPFLSKYWVSAAPKFFSLASVLLPQAASVTVPRAARMASCFFVLMGSLDSMGYD